MVIQFFQKNYWKDEFFLLIVFWSIRTTLNLNLAMISTMKN